MTCSGAPEQQPELLASFVGCPDCGRPAEVTDRFVLASTDGPIEHVALSCVDGHYFRMAADGLPAVGLELLPGRQPATRSAVSATAW
jgi:hypothetical protein